MPYLIQSHPPPQPDNPTDRQRYALARYALQERGRPEDCEYIFRLLAPPPPITQIAPPGSGRGIRVAVIGAGLAGLSAAFELRKLGFDITLYEALRDRIGGRVYTYYFNEEKTLYGDFGPMRIPVTHETVWHYIKLLGLYTRPFIQVNPNAWIYLNNVRVRNDPYGINVMRHIYPTYNLTPRERGIPWQQLSYYGLESPLLQASPAVRSEILRTLPVYSPLTLYWDKSNNRQILESKGLSQAAINMLSSLAPLAGRFLYNSYVDFIQEGYPVDLAFLYEFPGGLSQLPQALFKALSGYSSRYYPGLTPALLGDVDFQPGTWVTEIHRSTTDGRVILGYQKNATSESGYDVFDYVVCAIPFSTLRTMEINPLFSDVKMQAIRELTYVPSQKTLFLCNRRFWEEGGPGERILGGGSYTDLPITTVWYPSDHAKYGVDSGVQYPSQLIAPGRQSVSPPYAAEPGVLLASYNFNQDSIRLGNMPDRIRFVEIKQELEKMHGLPRGVLDTIVTDYRTIQWNFAPSFRGAFCYFTPEQKRLFSYPVTVPEYNGRVFFAGEHISPTHRWMQGALKTGMEAANGIAAACRRHEG